MELKRICAVVLSLVLIMRLCLSGFAEDGPGGGPELGVNPPEGMGESPRGGSGGGMGGPGGSDEKAEGVIGSWSSGGSEDYEYDAALYITSEGIDTEESATERIISGEYDSTGANGVVIGS